MDGDTDTIGTAGNAGPESILDANNASLAEHGGNAGAIDPDAARVTGDIGTGTDDFTAAFAEPVTDATELTPTGRQRRKRGPNKNREQQTARPKSSVDWIQKAIFGIHEVLGTAFAPELKLEPDEAKGISDAIDGIREAYEIPKLDPKTEALMNLGTVLTGIYGTRVVTIYVRKKMERENRKPPVQDNVTPIRPDMVQPAPTPQRPQNPLMFDPANQKPFNG